MLIRKNTKLFKSIQQLVADIQDRSDRGQLIRLYITKAGDTIDNRIGIEGIQGDAALFYEMTYQTVLSNLKSTNHQLHVSDETPGIYFFHSTSNKVWDETPFEFDEGIKKAFPSLAEFPVFRKKEPVANYAIPTAKSGSPPSRDPKTASKKKKKEPTKIKDLTRKAPNQPDFRLSQDIPFSNLDKLIFRQAGLTKLDVLTYYDKIADYLLPHLKNRPLRTRLQTDNPGRDIALTAAELFKNAELMPAWLKTADDRDNGRLLLCNDKEHLLLYVEMGCLAFAPALSRVKQIENPDWMVIAIDSPESVLGKVVNVALAMQEILGGLELPSFVKTDGLSGLHLIIPLDSRSNFQVASAAAAYICKLGLLKIPDLVTMKESGYVRGKVSLDYGINMKDKGVIAPYSLVYAASPVVATPLLWEEVIEGLRVETFNQETTFGRLADTGDPFASLPGKKVSAEALLHRLEDNYAFLF